MTGNVEDLIHRDKLMMTLRRIELVDDLYYLMFPRVIWFKA